MNVNNIVASAMKQLGLVAAGEKVTGDELVDALGSLRGLLAQWATDRLHVHKATILTLPLTKGVGAYQIGKIEGDCCEYELTCCGDVLARPDLSAEISHISDRAWLDDQEITMVRDLNNTASGIKVWYQMDNPNWIFHINEAAKELKIKVYTLPFDLCDHDELHLPPQYERALILTLALEIAPMFGVEPSATLFRNQSQAITILKRANVTPIYATNSALEIPAGVRHGWCY